MYCSRCGTRLPEGAGFCPDCGAEADESLCTTETVKKKGDGQAFLIAFAVSLVGGLLSLVLGFLAAAIAVVAVRLSGNESLASAVTGAAAGLALGLGIRIVAAYLILQNLGGLF